MTSISAIKSSRRGGRPRLAPEHVREAYGVRLSRRGREEARHRADEAGLDLSTYCRNAILNASSHRPVPRINREAWLQLNTLADALTELSKTQSAGVGGDCSVDQFNALRVLLQSTRFALLGIHHTPDDAL